MIRFEHVTKRYGKSIAIADMNLELLDKKIYCLLGRNGAGKTTFMNLIAGKIKASEGEVSIDGALVDTLKMPESVTYIEAAKRQFNMTVENLLALADGLNEDFDMDFARRMLDKFHLDKHKKYNNLSFGMKTMVTTLLSLSSNQEVLLLDEPVLGFDAIMRKRFYGLLQESFENRPRLILVSTHLIDEIADVAQQILIIEEGRILLDDDINTVDERAYKISGTTNEVEEASEGRHVLATQTIGKYTNCYLYDKRPESLKNVEVSNVTLQDLFINMVGGADNE